MADALLTGLSALTVHRRSMEVTSHNIANAATEGFSRQRTIIGPMTPEEIVPGTLGRGVETIAIDRQVDDLVNERYRKSFSEVGRLEALRTTLTDLELVYNEPGDGGFATIINQTFDTLEDLSNNPESVALRTGAVQQIETMSSTLRAMYGRLENMREDLRVAMDAEIQNVNRIAAQVSSLNQDIKRLVLASQNPNDMLDQRDRMVNELSESLNVRVFRNPSDQTVRIDLQGATLVSNAEAFPIARSVDSNGNMVVNFANGNRAEPGGGSLGALEELSAEILPGALDDINELASTLIQQFNALHATGLSHTYRESEHSGETRVLTANLDIDLDHEDQIRADNSVTGIAEAFLPHYYDESGIDIPRNLTINVYDTVEEVAKKYTVRYDPGPSVPASRSLQDLVNAINSGSAGGFTVYPPSAGGVTGVTARSVGVSDGLTFQLAADTRYSIDFSSSLDLRPSEGNWTGGDISVVGIDDAYSDERLNFSVINGGNDLRVFQNNPDTGQAIAVGIIDLTDPAGAAVIGPALGITVSWTPGAVYREGQSFAAQFTGNAVNHVETASWSEGAADFMIKGRYTGDQTFHPSRRWGMNVLQSGTVGAPSDGLPPDNPPVVEFVYYNGPKDAPVERRIQFVLDEDFPPGDQVPIADGVYAIFDPGLLTVGDSAGFTVDAHADEADLLPALGINTMLSGINAKDITVSDRLMDDPGSFAVSKVRSAGDNSNLLEIIGARHMTIFGPSGSTLDEYYQSQVSNAAVLTQQNQALLDNQTVLHQSLQNRREEISGVSIDEEVAMLIMQQQAYTAAARVITTAKENIDTLLNIL